MGDIGDEVLSDALEFLLLGDVVENKEHPAAASGRERRDQGAGGFEPNRAANLDEFKLLLGLSPAGANGVDEIEKCHAVQHDFKTLVEDVFRAGKNGLKGLVGQKDAILAVNEKHGLLEAAEGCVELRELAGAGLPKLGNLSDQLVGCRAQ